MISGNFINLIRIAKEDDSIRSTLLSLLRLNRFRRTIALEELLEKIKNEGAPAELIEAITPLCEDQIAEKALELLEIEEEAQ